MVLGAQGGGRRGCCSQKAHSGPRKAETRPGPRALRASRLQTSPRPGFWVSSVASAEWLNFSEPCSPCVENGDNTNPTGFWSTFNRLLEVRGLACVKWWPLSRPLGGVQLESSEMGVGLQASLWGVPKTNSNPSPSEKLPRTPCSPFTNSLASTDPLSPQDPSQHWAPEDAA